MIKKIRLYFPAFFMVLLTMNLAAQENSEQYWRWPGESFLFQRQYGERIDDSLYQGIVLETDKPVRSIFPARLLLRRNEFSRNNILPSPNGNIIALFHEGGLISIYSELGGFDGSLEFIEQKFQSNGTWENFKNSRHSSGQTNQMGRLSEVEVEGWNEPVPMELYRLYRNEQTEDSGDLEFSDIQNEEDFDQDSLIFAEPIGFALQDLGGQKADFAFAIYDLYRDRSINPRLILPEINDQSRPVLNYVSIREEDRPNTLIPLYRQPRLLTGTYEIQMSFFDSQDFVANAQRIGSLSSEQPLMVQRAVLLWNGEIILDYQYSEIKADSGVLLNAYQGSLPFDDAGYFTMPWIIPVNVISGNNTFEILLWDYVGNESSYTYRIRGIEPTIQ